jgi:glycerophosphoryl diester phosphodiesterase
MLWFLTIPIIILTLFILYLLAIMPKLTRRPDITPWKGWYFAHRGLHQSHKKSPENSMAAFKLAVEKGFGIELDVQLSKDRVPVVFHDYTLIRICGVDKKVCDLTLKELQELRLYTSNEQIPTLESVLNLVDGKVPLIVEFKVESHDTSVCDVVAPMLDKYKGLYCIESFNPLALMWYKKNRPNVMRGQLSSNLIKDKESGDPSLYFILQNLLLNFVTKPHFIAYNHLHSKMPSFVLCRNLYRIPTFAWTIKSQEALESSKKSFDFFIFDHFIPQD